MSARRANPSDRYKPLMAPKRSRSPDLS